MKKDTKIQTDIFNLPLWSAPFGLELLRNINYSFKKNILDIGTGTGFPIMELSQRFGKTTTLYGIDVEIESIQELKDQLSFQNIKNVILQNADVENLPFNDDFFDLIVSNNGINNVKNKELAIKECSRVCKKGAEFVFTFNLNTTFNEFYDLFKIVLKELSLFKEIDLIDVHINDKRPSIELIQQYLNFSNFEVLKISKLDFDMSFNDGTTFFNHYFIRKYFLSVWGEIIPIEFRRNILQKIESELNKLSQYGYLTFNVPYVCVKCRKK